MYNARGAQVCAEQPGCVCLCLKRSRCCDPDTQYDLALLAGSKNKPRPHSQPATASGAAAAAAAGEDDTIDVVSQFATTGDGSYALQAGDEAMPVHSGRSRYPMAALHDHRGRMRWVGAT